MKFGILLDSGYIIPCGVKTKRGAHARLWRYKEIRRWEVENNSMVTPRQALGLVIYRTPKQRKAGP